MEMKTKSPDDRSAMDEAYGIVPPGYRLPAATRLGVVRLQVADLDRSLAWYRHVLGLEALARDVTPNTGTGASPSTRAALLGVRGSDEALIELHEHPGAVPVARRGRLGLYHYALLVPDRAALGRFLRHLSAIGERAGMSDHFVSEALYLSDPDGLGIEVYADRPRSAWRHEDRQLAMTTKPLDAADILRAGGAAEWTGMSSGTVMGHVHLFVGDLERAAAFYHGGLGLDKTVWSYPGALFLSAGGYHHHLGTNTWAQDAPPAGPDDARLLEWELVVPSARDAQAAMSSIEASGGRVDRTPEGGVARDPWGTAVRVRGAA